MTEPGETYDPVADHVIVLGRRDASEARACSRMPTSVVVNGERAPRWVWRAGARHRVRLINITPDDILSRVAAQGRRAVMWRPLTKDGAPVPAVDSQLVLGDA